MQMELQEFSKNRDTITLVYYCQQFVRGRPPPESLAPYFAVLDHEQAPGDWAVEEGEGAGESYVEDEMNTDEPLKTSSALYKHAQSSCISLYTAHSESIHLRTSSVFRHLQDNLLFGFSGS